MGVYTDIDCKTTGEKGRIIAFAGNPNVGKSTLFNSLTGMKQHTGNWTGKTVELAFGEVDTDCEKYTLVDLPGTYSLMAHSREEEVARDYVCFGKCDAVVVVCDATSLERNLNLAIQISELSPRMMICLNLCDEAKRKGITVNENKLESMLGINVVKTIGRKKKSAEVLKNQLSNLFTEEDEHSYQLKYRDEIESAVGIIESALCDLSGDTRRSRFLALRIIEGAPGFEKKIDEYYNKPITSDDRFIIAKKEANELLVEFGYNAEKIKDEIVGTINYRANEIYNACCEEKGDSYSKTDRFLDKVFTGKFTGIPIMLAFVMLVFWLTIVGANYPSQALSLLFSYIGQWLYILFDYIRAPVWLSGILLDGAYNVLSTVVSVMLPPMAIFFPLFTLLEDSGYLPRIAYNLDRPFRQCNACGKQALTMCMGFGCNAVGVVGARIIDSPRERLLAILTNSFSPCNGRFPMLIAIIAVFFGGAGVGSSAVSSVLLSLFIVLSIWVTFIATKLLSCTLLKGTPSSFILELPPYRPPQIWKVIVRSVYERTLTVLGRAASVAAPAGMLLWLLANVNMGDRSILLILSDFIDPLGRAMGLDGVILVGFLLGLPANEIVLPIIIMCYTAAGKLTDIVTISAIKDILTANGWTVVTAINVILFSIMHWPCSTTLLTIKRETGSVLWTVLAAVYPTLFGIIACISVNLIFNLF